MTTDDLTLEKLTDSVGAAVHGVDRDRLLHDDELPGWTLDALEHNGALVGDTPITNRVFASSEHELVK